MLHEEGAFPIDADEIISTLPPQEVFYSCKENKEEVEEGSNNDDIYDSRISVNLPNYSSKVTLTVSILDQIASSIKAFKPSLSFPALCSKASKLNLAGFSSDHDIDVVVSGGGLKGYFVCGSSHVLQYQLRRKGLRIARVAGASAGAWAAMFMLTKVSSKDWIQTYMACKETPDVWMHESYERIWIEWLQHVMAADAYITCNDRLFVSITVLTIFGPRNRIISKFTSNEDLIQCCLASSAIPMITGSKLRRFRGELVLDGGVTNNCPVFTDGLRRQMVFNLGDLEYPFQLWIQPRDHCIEAFVIRGALLMARFLEGEKSECIAWLKADDEKAAEQNEKTDVEKYRMSAFQRSIKTLLYPSIAVTATLACIAFVYFRKVKR
jgi:hypothetical protein